MGKTKAGGFHVVGLLVFLVVIGVAAAIVWRVVTAPKPAATNNPNTTSNMSSEPLVVKGVSLSPKSFTAGDFAEFLQQAVQAGKAITWGGEWKQLQNPGSAPFTVAKLAKQYGYTPIIIVGSTSWNTADKPAFVAALKDFAKTYRPKYIGVGNEVNRLHASSPANYATLVDWFSSAAAAIKESSPNTKVFTTFQYEQLNGLNGGLFGGKNDPAAAQWQLLADFSKADLIAFTTYPYLIYSNPNAIPDDYYSRLVAHTAKPVAFTEIGWPSGTEAAGYESTPQEQADFVDRFFALSKDVHAQFDIWPFLYEQTLPKPFTYTGLIDAAGNAKPALARWEQASQ